MNVGTNTEKSILVNPKIKPENFLKDRNQLNFLIAHISHEEVLDIIHQLENKSTGPQSIPMKPLKLMPDLILNQFGFRKNKTIDDKRYGCGIFIDLRKAFDTVNHDILLRKLEHYGIRGKAQIWFRSYLTNRKQYVSLNSVPSELKQTTCGVPQGSCLGPLLFLVYINDLSNISEVLKFYLFADDNIYYEAESIKKLETVTNKELRKLDTWLTVNRLSLNIAKTNFLIFHPYNKPINL